MKDDDHNLNKNSKIALISHHPPHLKIGVCATIYNVFLHNNFIKNELKFLYTKSSVDDFILATHNSINQETITIANGLNSVLNINGIYALRHSALSGGRTIIYVHENAWNINNAKRMSSLYWTQLCQVVAKGNIEFWVVSAKTKQLVMLAFNARFEDVAVVWEAVSLPKEKSNRFNIEAFSFAGAGCANDSRKGLDYFIALSEDVGACLPNADFTWYWDVAKEDVEQVYGKPVNVRFPGFVSDLPAALQQHDAFILISRDDPCPIVAIEALGIDMPVFCFDVTGTAEFVPPEFIATDYPEMLDNIKNYMRMSKKYPKGFFRNIAAQFTPDKFWERIRKPISAKIVSPVEIKKPNIRTLRQHYINGKEAERLLMTDKSGKDPKTDILIKLLEQWPADRANSSPQTITDFERMVGRMLPDCDPACKPLWNMLDTANNNSPIIERVTERISSCATYSRILIMGLGKNGQRFLADLTKINMPSKMKIFGWDDVLTENEIADMKLIPFDSKDIHNLLNNSLIVITPLAPDRIIKTLLAFNVDWARDVIMSDERFDSEFSRF